MRNTVLKITLNAPQVGALVAGRQQVEAGLDARWAPVLFPPPSLRHWPVWRGRRILWRLRQSCPAASESNRAEEGGKEELKGERGPKGRRAGGPTASPRRDLCRAHRGRTQGRAAMERSAEEDYKEKLLWNVKREVGEALAFSFTFMVFNGCFLLLITWKPTKGCSGVLRPRWVFLKGVLNPAVKFTNWCWISEPS